jgi:hypothetical protein
VPAASLPATLIFTVTVSNGSLATVKTTTVTVESPFVVTATAPTASAIDVPSTPVISATFSQPVDPSTVTPSSVVLYGPAQTPVAATVGYTSSTVTLTPSGPLAFKTTYTARVVGGTAGVKDASGTLLSSDVTWTFTTIADLVPPAITAVKATVTGTSAAITWTTNEASTSRVEFGTVPGALVSQVEDLQLVTSHSVTLTGLTANTTYYFRVTSADGASNSATSPAAGAAPLAFYVANPSGLVAAFGFEEGAGPTSADVSGAGNAATIVGATWTTAGRFGNGLAFDGASNLVTVNDATSLDLTGGMTLEAWVRPTALTGWRTILYKENPGVGPAWALYGSDSNAPPAVYAATATDPWRHVTGPSMLTANTWAHVAGTYDGTTLRLYVNGALVRSAAATGEMPTTAGLLGIGGKTFGSAQFFAGVIDEVRIYNRALTQAQIQADMNNPVR